MKQQHNEDNAWLRFLMYGEEQEPAITKKPTPGGPKKPRPMVSNKQRRAIRNGN
jgi:hypothetical protein